jgi:hypothetical protein
MLPLKRILFGARELDSRHLALASPMRRNTTDCNRIHNMMIHNIVNRESPHHPAMHLLCYQTKTKAE